MPRHRFVKGLRLNMPASRPLASAVTPDAEEGPTALYIVRTGVGEDYERVLEELTGKSQLQSWIWRLEKGEMPPLPRRVDRGFRGPAPRAAEEASGPSGVLV